MSQIGHSGSTRSEPVDYSSHPGALASAQPLDEVSRGDLDGENIEYSREAAKNDALKGQKNRAPELDAPNDVKPTHLESASSEVGDLGKANEKALTSVSELAIAIKEGKLTPEQKAQLQKIVGTLEGAAELLSNLHGHNVDTAEGKRSVLAGLGFSESQLDALMSFSDPEEFNQTLTNKMGGKARLQDKKDDLKSMGFSDSQVDALLSLADPDDEGNNLASTHQPGSGKSRSALSGNGFSAEQMERLNALLNGQKFGTDAQKALLQKMGFDSEAVDVLLAMADPFSREAQGKLIQSTNEEVAEQLLELFEVANNITQEVLLGNPNGGLNDEIVNQLVDIFVVLELLHEMSTQARRTARETRSLEYDAAKQQVLNQAAEMRTAAKYTVAAGVTSGTFKIAAGAAAIGGSLGGGSAARTSIRMQRATQGSQMISGAGEILSSGFNYEASRHQAAQKEHEAFQKTHENAAQSSSEWMQLQQDMVKTVQSKLDEIIRTWFETLKTTTRG